MIDAPAPPHFFPSELATLRKVARHFEHLHAAAIARAADSCSCPTDAKARTNLALEIALRRAQMSEARAIVAELEERTDG